MLSPNRILIIRFSSLGDIILLTPLFRELHRVFPGVEIDFLTSTAFADVCANNPHLREIIAIDRRQGAAALDTFIRSRRPDEYGLVLDAHRSLRSRLLLLRWMGPCNRFNRKTVHIDKRSFKRILLLKTGINLMRQAVSQREAYLRLIPRITPLFELESHTELYPSPDDRQAVNRTLVDNGLQHQRLVAIGPGASFTGKCWPRERFLELSERLQSAGFRIIILGSAEEAEPEWIFRNSSNKPLNLAGQLTFLETAAMLENCSLAVSNDTAVVHFAEAMQVPSIAIFGPTSREFGYGPFLEHSRILEVGLPCRPCSRNGKGSCRNSVQRRCLRDISVDSVLEASLHILGR